MFRMEPGIIEFDYINYRGGRRHRRAEIKSIFWGTSEYYKVPTWLAEGVDLERNVRRIYNMSNMSSVVHLS